MKSQYGSYGLALLIRFYVNSTFRPTVAYLLQDYLTFAPFYTVACILIFWRLKLYNGMWRYAGLNDINRITLASLSTTIVMVAGTLIVGKRMPITYYVIGAILQFVFIALIRFGYRIFLMEKRKLAKFRANTENVMVVGSGENAMRVMEFIEGTSALRAVVVYAPSLASSASSSTSSTSPDRGEQRGEQGNNKGSRRGEKGSGRLDKKDERRLMNGIPVVSCAPADVEKVFDQYKIANVFIADPLLDNETRRRITNICMERRVDLKDYAGYLLY